MRKLGLKFDIQLLENFESWFKDITKETEETVEKSVSIQGEATLKPEKNVSKDDIGQLMLFNTSVLEYNGNKRWNYPNPVVRQNEFFQKDIKSALAAQP